MMKEAGRQRPRSKAKGQSAIEYLMTYGWMLLVVAIVGGAIFATIQDQTQIETTGGLANADVQIEEFTTTASGLEVEITAAGSDQAEDISLWVFEDGELERDDFQDDVSGNASAQDFFDSYSPNADDEEDLTGDNEAALINTSQETVTLPIADSEVVSLGGFSGSENVNDFEIAFVYDMGEFDGQTEFGSITGEVEVDE